MRINLRIGATALVGSGLLLSVAALLPASRGVAAPTTRHITISNNPYTPTTLSVNAGDTVQWDWPAPPNATNHTVTSDGPDTTLDSPQQATGTYSHTFDTAGVFHFHCEFHPTEMTGTITVAAAVAPTNTAPAASSTPLTATASRTPSATGTVTAIATGTPGAAPTLAITPTHTSGLAPTAVAVRPSGTPAAGAGAAAQLPRTGTGGTHIGSRRFGWLGLVLAIGGLGMLGVVPIAARRRQ